MIKAGTVLCPVCGHLFKEACYGHGERLERLVLKKGIAGGGWFVEEYHEDKREALSSARYELKTARSDIADGMPERIEVSVNSEKAEIYHRCCPHCEDMTIIPKHWGKVPSYVVCVAGLGQEGKTCLLTAMATGANLAALAGRGYRSKLTTAELEENTGAAITTMKDSIGATKVFQIWETGKDASHLVANVMFRDGAGELYKKEERNHPIHRFLKARGDYPDPDAFMLIHSAKANSKMLGDICNFIHDEVDGKWPVTAYVLTHVDEVGEWKLPCEDGTEVPIKLQGTFPPCNTRLPAAANSYYERDNVLPRWTLQDMLVRGKYPILAQDLNFAHAPSRGFLVKSCVKEGERLNYDYPINVMDPALWILNQLGLYTLRRVGE